MTPPYRGKHRRTTADDEGQVSEVASFGVPGDAISPEDATAGYPDSESGPPTPVPPAPTHRPDTAEVAGT